MAPKPSNTHGNSPTEKVPPRNTEEPIEEYGEEITSSRVPTSPAHMQRDPSSLEEISSHDEPANYPDASRFLQQLPDFGQHHMEHVSDEQPDLPIQTRVIHAARAAGWKEQKAS